MDWAGKDEWSRANNFCPAALPFNGRVAVMDKTVGITVLIVGGRWITAVFDYIEGVGCLSRLSKLSVVLDPIRFFVYRQDEFRQRIGVVPKTAQRNQL